MSQPIRLQILERARAKVANPKTWTQGEEARDPRGIGCDWWSDGAVRFCAYGALGRSGIELGLSIHDADLVAMRISLKVAPGADANIERINDAKGGRKAVLTRFDKAIQEAKS